MRKAGVLVIVGFLNISGCGESSVAPTPSPQQIPESVEVSWEALPIPFNERTYFRSMLAVVSPDSMFQLLIENNIKIKNAWWASDKCSTLPIAISELIVELVQSDPGVLEQGFRQTPPARVFCFDPVFYYAFSP